MTIERESNLNQSIHHRLSKQDRDESATKCYTQKYAGGMPWALSGLLYSSMAKRAKRRVVY